ncbi:RimK-like ATP-grasp domain-containing protein [Streptosporangium subroseum]|uniref:RimK-like ATP-grasp domain-containing protein n=1 Tax=Streptosporangium subroseum TaxID=106412 RepID=A0A239P679_9ACTN|nr:ATP-dependent carboxylate-amine ligase [Streptosporangium subroseum]SNT62164.1 RimK-like ATP-grasp domain-containing protein [Streptosporangium subroseum]
MSGEILVLTRPDDTHALHVGELLTQRGADVVFFDPEDYPAKAVIDVSYEPSGRVRRTLRTHSHRVDLDGLTAVWTRRPQSPVCHPKVAELVARAHLERELAVFTGDLWDQLDCRMVPGSREVIKVAGRKPSQLALAGRLGFELPPTLISNDPDEFLDFYSRHDGRIITKPLHMPWAPRDGGESVSRLSELVSPRDIGYADAIRFAPIIIQAYVPKRVELRVTVVGDRVFAAEIHSQESNHTRFDWRRYDAAMTRHAVHELPPETAERCVHLVRRLGLVYGAIDLILTPDGRYVFLEINPNGQWLWIEETTGLPISEALCDVLYGGASIPKEVHDAGSRA